MGTARGSGRFGLRFLTVLIVATIAVWGVVGIRHVHSVGVIQSGSPIAAVGGDKSFMITITCTPGLRFQGTFMTVSSSGATSSSPLSGMCPRTGDMHFGASGMVVSATAQKHDEGDGLLSIEIWVQGATPPLVHSATRDPFGVVVAATP